MTRLHMKTYLSTLRDAAINLWSVRSSKSVGSRFWRRIWLIIRSFAFIRIWSARFVKKRVLIDKQLIIICENAPKLTNAKNAWPLWVSKTRKLTHASLLSLKGSKPKRTRKTNWSSTSLSSWERKRPSCTNYEKSLLIWKASLSR